MKAGFESSLLAVALLAFLGGCTQKWARPGSTDADYARVRQICDARGLDVYPPKLEDVPSGTGDMGCMSSGMGMSRSCSSSSAPTTMTVDNNESAREKESDTCMQQNGWKPAG